MKFINDIFSQQCFVDNSSVLYQKQALRATIIDDIQQMLWDVLTYSRPCYLLLIVHIRIVHKASRINAGHEYRSIVIILKLLNNPYRSFNY